MELLNSYPGLNRPQLQGEKATSSLSSVLSILTPVVDSNLHLSILIVLVRFHSL